jgi:hypothetical protein
MLVRALFGLDLQNRIQSDILAQNGTAMMLKGTK